MPSRLEDCTSGRLALFRSTTINTQMAQSWTRVWLDCQGPRKSLLTLASVCSTEVRGRLPLILVEILASMFGAVGRSVFSFWILGILCPLLERVEPSLFAQLDVQIISS